VDSTIFNPAGKVEVHHLHRVASRVYTLSGAVRH